ncbi:MAG: hypothetical protein ABJB47_10340 [Actinomycetota bacterium]
MACGDLGIWTTSRLAGVLALAGCPHSRRGIAEEAKVESRSCAFLQAESAHWALQRVILAGMAERKLTCGECGASVTIPDGDWNDFQKPAAENWERQHAEEIHGGDDSFAVAMEPDLRDD